MVTLVCHQQFNTTTVEKLQHRIQCLPQTEAFLDTRIDVFPNDIQLSSIRNRLASISISFLNSNFKSLLASINTQQPLWRAMGKQVKTSSVYDLTAGLGRDSLILASLGARVVSVEHNPLLYALLDANVAMLLHTSPLDWLVVHADSNEWLPQQSTPQTIAYMDPYFYNKSNSLPQKGMQWLQYLDLHTASNDQQLFTTCMSHATRTVVKRPAHAPLLSSHKPNGTIQQKSTRFDCYM